MEKKPTQNKHNFIRIALPVHRFTVIHPNVGLDSWVKRNETVSCKRLFHSSCVLRCFSPFGAICFRYEELDLISWFQVWLDQVRFCLLGLTPPGNHFPWLSLPHKDKRCQVWRYTQKLVE